jgi:3'-phosphoadenosine 5'-phosphosulfate sulfotransferase (PAPS reductase)/FAD synthetase
MFLEKKPIHIAMFSGGASSAYVAYLMVNMHGQENCRLFFTDTLWEHDDNYRFMYEVADYLGVELVKRRDGRTPEEVFDETRFLGNSRLAKCSSQLKVRQTTLYIEELRDDGLEPILYFGIGPHEAHRKDSLFDFYSHQTTGTVQTRFPLIEGNLKDIDIKLIIQDEWKIKLPVMYELGFSHANCGGRCVRGGMGHYRHLHKVWPDQYAAQEQMEEKFRKNLGEFTILKRKGQPLTLKQFRLEIEREGVWEFAEEENDLPCVCVYA